MKKDWLELRASTVDLERVRILRVRRTTGEKQSKRLLLNSIRDLAAELGCEPHQLRLSDKLCDLLRVPRGFRFVGRRPTPKRDHTVQAYLQAVHPDTNAAAKAAKNADRLKREQPPKISTRQNAERILDGLSAKQDAKRVSGPSWRTDPTLSMGAFYGDEAHD